MGEEARFVILLRREARVTRFRQRERGPKRSPFFRLSGSLGQRASGARNTWDEMEWEKKRSRVMALLQRVTSRALLRGWSLRFFPRTPLLFGEKKVPPRKGGTSRPAGDRSGATSETGSLGPGFRVFQVLG